MSSGRAAEPVHEVLLTRGLGKRFGEVVALDGVELRLLGPQLIGILGPNGAGKTTLLDIVEGLSEPTAGEVRLLGGPLSPYPRRRVGVVLHREFALDHVKTGEYAELFAAIYGVAGGRQRILERAELLTRADVAVERLSSGEAQRLFIAAASVHDPELLLLDEPTAHLDPEAKQKLGRWLRETSRTRTVVITTHDLAEAEAICDHVVFLVRGRVRAQGSPVELTAAVPEPARAGLASAFFHFCAVRIAPDGGADGEAA